MTVFVGFCRKRGRRTIATRQNTLASLLCATVLVGGIPVGKADTIPIPPKRPETIPREQHPASNTNLTPSSCQLRLGEIAIFKALPPIAGPGECFAADVVAVEGMLLAQTSCHLLTSDNAAVPNGRSRSKMDSC